MKRYHVLIFFSILVMVASRIEARAVPTNSQEVAGINIGGLHADLKTNLFSSDGPLAQLGNEIASGASQLQNELTSGAQALQGDLQNAKNVMAQGSQEEIAGVNIGGLHAELKTNLLSDNGPLAQVGNDLAAGEQQLQNDFAKGANALGASLTDAANAFQAQLAGGADLLTNGLKNLGQQPTNSQEVAGINIGGLHADLKTNLFSPDGPLAQLGNEIASGTSQLQNELTSGAQALEADMQNAKNFMLQFQNDFANGANALGASLTNAANAFQAQLTGVADLLTNGFKNLVQQVNKFLPSIDLFAPDGPLAQLGNEIASGTSQLQNELTSGIQALQADLQNAKNFMAQGSQEEIAGVNIGGLHAELKTNLLSDSGPLAQIGNDLAEGELQLQNDFAKGANALGASLTNAANAFQAQLTGGADLLTNGFKDLEQQISSGAGGGSLNDLFKGTLTVSNNEANSGAVESNPLQIKEAISGESNTKPLNTKRTIIKMAEPSQDSAQDEAAKTGNALLSILQGDNSGGTNGGSSMKKTLTITGQTSGDMTDLFKDMQLPNMCGNYKEA